MPNLSEERLSRPIEASGGVSPDGILIQLEAVLQSETFKRSDRLRRLLRYIVEQTLGGSRALLDENSIRGAVFNEAASPTPRASPVVRVEAHRLRWKLAEYYAREGHRDPIEIALSHRAYHALFRERLHDEIRTQDQSAARSLLVLRFENLEGGAKAAVFSRGLMSELLYALSQLRDLRIVAGNAWSAERVRDALAGSEIDVVLEGKVRYHGRTLRLNAQVTTADSTVLWSQIYEHSNTAYPVQQQLAWAISHDVGRVLCVSRKPGASVGATDRMAEMLYVRGCYHLHQPSPEGLKTAVRSFEQAVALASGYALAHVGLAEAYTLLALIGECPVLDIMPRVRRAALCALEIDPAIAEPHVALGVAAALLDWDLIRAKTELQTSIETELSGSPARVAFACCCLVPNARFQEAITEMRCAVELDPLSLTAQNLLGWTLHVAGRSDEALEQLRLTLDLEPTFHLTHWSLGLVYEELGEPERAIAAFQKARELGGNLPSVLSALGHAYGQSGREERAKTVLREIQQLGASRYIPAVDIALIHTGLRDNRAALDWLERAADERCAWVLWLGADPRLRPLQREPRMQQLLRRIGLAVAAH